MKYPRVSTPILFGYILAVLAAVPAARAQEQDHSFVHMALGMGIDVHSAPSIVDYINALTVQGSTKNLDEFATATEFFVTPEFSVAGNWSVGLEYAYLLKSYSVNDGSGLSRWDFSYSMQMPTLLAHYVIPDDAYWLKFGGGVGYYFGSMKQSYAVSGSEDRFSAQGLGMKLDVSGNTKFDDHFYGYIGADLRWCFAGELKNDQGLTPTYNGVTAKMNFFSLGLKFGVVFQL
ncbi:MAG: hypothetical protein WBD36_08320 [Bacteroidota bacterium]